MIPSFPVSSSLTNTMCYATTGTTMEVESSSHYIIPSHTPSYTIHPHPPKPSGLKSTHLIMTSSWGATTGPQVHLHHSQMRSYHPHPICIHSIQTLISSSVVTLTSRTSTGNHHQFSHKTHLGKSHLFTLITSASMDTNK